MSGGTGGTSAHRCNPQGCSGGGGQLSGRALRRRHGTAPETHPAGSDGARVGPTGTARLYITMAAVRRRLNKAADRLATLGVFWAACLRRQGLAQVTTHTVWHTSSSPAAPCHLHFPDPSAASLDPAIVRQVADHLEDLARAARQTGRGSA